MDYIFLNERLNNILSKVKSVKLKNILNDIIKQPDYETDAKVILEKIFEPVVISAIKDKDVILADKDTINTAFKENVISRRVSTSDSLLDIFIDLNHSLSAFVKYGEHYLKLTRRLNVILKNVYLYNIVYFDDLFLQDLVFFDRHAEHLVFREENGKEVDINELFEEYKNIVKELYEIDNGRYFYSVINSIRINEPKNMSSDLYDLSKDYGFDMRNIRKKIDDGVSYIFFLYTKKGFYGFFDVSRSSFDSSSVYLIDDLLSKKYGNNLASYEYLLRDKDIEYVYFISYYDEKIFNIRKSREENKQTNDKIEFYQQINNKVAHLKEFNIVSLIDIYLNTIRDNLVENAEYFIDNNEIQIYRAIIKEIQKIATIITNDSTYYILSNIVNIIKNKIKDKNSDGKVNFNNVSIQEFFEADYNIFIEKVISIFQDIIRLLDRRLEK